MKLRLRKDSIRLRLTRGEVAEFAERGIMEDSVQFNLGSRLSYRLSADADAAEFSASFAGDIITITAPLDFGRNWAGSEQVGIEVEQKIRSDGVLKILIEKDFTCLEPRPGGEDDDTFPHPRNCGD